MNGPPSASAVDVVPEAPGRLAPAAINWAGRGARAVGPLVLTLAVGAAVLAATGRNPLSVYHLYLVQAAGDWPRLANTFSAATPLLLTGVGTAIAFRAGFFNVGLEGSVYVGALATAWVGAGWTAVSGPVVAATAVVAGIVAGTLWLLLPALLRAYLAIDEVVTTLMFNYVAIALTSYVVLYHLLYQTIGNAQTRPVPHSVQLDPLVSGTTLTVAAPIGLALVLLYGVFLRRARLGVEVRMVGDNSQFAAAVGFSVRRAALLTMLVGGALGGLAGAFVVLGVTHNFTSGFSTQPGYGYSGIAVAVLGRNSWTGLLLASLFFGGLASAGGVIQLFGNVPIALTQILQGTLMIFAGVQLVRLRRGRKRVRAARQLLPPAGEGAA